MKIEIYADNAGETRYRVVAPNNQIILTPHDGYTREADCERAIHDHMFGILRALVQGLPVVHVDGTMTVIGMPRDEKYDKRPRSFGPTRSDDAYLGTPCPACQVAFVEGDYVALVRLGPGSRPEAQQKCREGLTYNAVGAVVHYACATGEEK